MTRWLRWYARLIAFVGVVLATAMSGGEFAASIVPPRLASAVGMHDTGGELGARGPLAQTDGTPVVPAPISAPAPNTDICKRGGTLPPGTSVTFHAEGTNIFGPVQVDVTVAVGSNPCRPNEFVKVQASFERGTVVTIRETAPPGYAIAGCIAYKQGGGHLARQSIAPSPTAWRSLSCRPIQEAAT
jgi:hypothetical protein